jgi:hypothetical protein
MSYTGSGERRCPVHVRPVLELLGSAPRCLRRNSVTSMEWRRGQGRGGTIRGYVRRTGYQKFSLAREYQAA